MSQLYALLFAASCLALDDALAAGRWHRAALAWCGVFLTYLFMIGGVL